MTKENKKALMFGICITSVLFLMWWCIAMGFQAGIDYCNNPY